MKLKLGIIIIDEPLQTTLTDFCEIWHGTRIWRTNEARRLSADRLVHEEARLCNSDAV